MDSTDDTTWVTVVLFGELQYSLGIATDLEPVGPRVWLCDHRESRPIVFDSITSYAAAIAERYVMFGDFLALRHERPRGQLVGPRNRAVLRESTLPQ
ncbi:hypothetical protein LRS13_08310 [Svornostia abyssi]|uniref:Uncharacterized protein n=1 Tax=Svornostia abyssi TaxID=2898438 RepID=A0ABY5PLE7_9ACTN|nr:hypothetical protein LRS13_08310 [Parviterribacteraceae bacterium J379]